MTASSSWHTEWKAFKKTIQQHLRKTTFLNVCMSLRSKCWSGRELGSHEKDEETDLLGTEIGKKQCSKIEQSQSLNLFIFSKKVPMCSQ